MDHGRTIAAVIGIAVEMGIICSGEIYIGESGRIVKVIAGCYHFSTDRSGIGFYDTERGLQPCGTYTV